MPRRGLREITTTVCALTEDGLGQGEFEGHTVQVRNALPGETVDLRVLKRRRGVWFGEADTPGVVAPERRVPPCPNYPRCGGCVLQHVDYAAQLEHKSTTLRTLLDQHGVAAERFRPAVSGPQFHYRFKARLGVRLVGDELLVGFREGFSNRVVRMSDCKTIALPFARMLPALKRTLAAMREPDRIPQVELAGGDREFAVIVRHLGCVDDDDRSLLRGFARETGIRVFLQPGGYETVTPLDEEQGSAPLSYANPDYGLCFEFLPTDFTQVNPYMNRALVRAALGYLPPRSEASATDLFCGIGNFSLALSRTGVRVHGHESSTGAVERARRNAQLNGLAERAEFTVADLYDARCPELPDANYILLDPPRSGAGPNLERWAGSRSLERIVYVSCNPRTFASDAVLLQRLGFTLREVGVFDMFPHTAHLETLGLFVRRPGSSRHG